VSEPDVDEKRRAEVLGVFSVTDSRRASSRGAPCSILPSKLRCFPFSGCDNTAFVIAPRNALTSSYITGGVLSATIVGAPASPR
jgi:hypothetical protein